MKYTVTLEPARGQATIRTDDGFEMGIAIEDLSSDVTEAKALIETRLTSAKADYDARVAAEATRIVEQDTKVASLRTEFEGRQFTIVDKVVADRVVADKVVAEEVII